MAKLTQIDKAIAQLEGEKRVIEMAIDKLRSAQASKPARAKKPKPAVVAEMPTPEARR